MRRAVLEILSFGVVDFGKGVVEGYGELLVGDGDSIGRIEHIVEHWKQGGGREGTKERVREIIVSLRVSEYARQPQNNRLGTQATAAYQSLLSTDDT